MYFIYQAVLGWSGHIDFFKITMDLMKGLMMHIIDQEQHNFGLLQCTLISVLLYLSNLLQDKTLYLPQILGQIYTPEQTEHT